MWGIAVGEGQAFTYFDQFPTRNVPVRQYILSGSILQYEQTISDKKFHQFLTRHAPFMKKIVKIDIALT